jgi:phospholipid/cholesterol/gamma-HCH transport system substrate-binding protein
MKRRDEVLVGILLVAATIVGVLGTLWLVRGGLSSGYPLYTVVPWGAGLTQGQPVLLAGAKVGYVADIELRQNGTLLVTLNVNKDYKVPQGSTATVKAVGLFGDQSIALTPDYRRPINVYIPPGDTLPSGPTQVSIDQLLMRVDTVSRGLSDVAKTFQVEMVQQGGIADLRQTLTRTNALVSQLSGIAAEQSRQLTATMTQLRHTMAAVDSTQIDSTVRNLQRTSANVAALSADLQKTSLQINSVLAKIDSGGGTAGKLINDPGLYNDLRRLTARLDTVTADFKAHPKKYVNLSIF